VRVGVQVLLRERRCASLCLWVLQVQRLKDLLHRRRRPRFDVHPCLAFDLGLQILDLGPQTFADHVRLVQIDAHAARTHVHHQRDQRCFELEDVRQVLAADLCLESVPQLHGHERVLLGVGPDVGWRQSPHVSLGVDAPVLGCSAQHLLVLAHVDVVAAQIVQAVREAVLVHDGAGDHRVNNSTLNVNPLCAQPAQIVGGVVHDLVDVRRSHLLGEPLEGHPRIEVVAVLVADREVPSLIARGDGNAHDEPVVARPAGPQCREVRVASL